MDSLRHAMDLIIQAQNIPEPSTVMFSEYTHEALFLIARAHSWHLQTSSYAQHKAFQEFYESLQELIDKVSEAFIGINGVLVPTSTNFVFDLQENAAQSITEFHQTTTSMLTKFENSPTITVTLEEILSTCAGTLYKINQLH